VVALPQLAASAGRLNDALALRKGPETSSSGNFVLSDFSGRYGDYQFQNYQTTFDLMSDKETSPSSERRLAVRQGSNRAPASTVAASSTRP